MARFHTLRLLLVLGALAPGMAARAADPSPVPSGPARRTFVATGPISEEELARLRAALLKVNGVLRIEVRPQAGGATVAVEGESSSLLSAAARSVGFTLRPAPTRSFAATGPTGAAERTRLAEALRGVEGVDRVEIGPHAEGAALRVTGVATTPQLTGTARTAGFTIKQVGAYVAAGPSAPSDLQRLRAALAGVPGIDNIELNALDGGATLLLHGDASDAQLATAGKQAGFDLWPLGNAAGAREFRITAPADQQKLRQLLEGVEGAGVISFRQTDDGVRLVLRGGRARPDRVVGAARSGGIELVPLEEAVTLPTALPEAGRGTPPDYDHRVLDDEAKPGAEAPDFALVGPDGQTRVRLSDYRGKRPVVLLFGSCT